MEIIVATTGIIIGIIGLGYAALTKKKCIQLDKSIIAENEKLKEENEALWQKNADINHLNENISEETKELSKKRKIQEKQLNQLIQQQQIINTEIEIKKEQRNDLMQNIDELSSGFKATARASFEQYCDSLDAEYILKEQEFDTDLENLNKLYANQHDSLLQEMSKNAARANEQKEQLNQDLDIIRKELEKIRSTRAATMEAQLREEEIKDKATFYTLQLNDADKRDVAYLKSIEYNLREARPLRMLIWSTFYRDKVNDLAARVGAVGASGIYKLTHIDSGISYIGQAKDIKERWVSHVKCSLGIDTPVTSQLYAFTREKGIDNFTFEVLEKCSINELNEKEKFYIDLYQTYDFGLNANRGVSKN